MWDIPTMKVCIADQKKRVVLPNVTPGECFQVREIQSGHLELLRLVPQESTQPISPTELEHRWKQFALTPGRSWDELRKDTRDL